MRQAGEAVRLDKRVRLGPCFSQPGLLGVCTVRTTSSMSGKEGKSVLVFNNRQTNSGSTLPRHLTAQPGQKSRRKRGRKLKLWCATVSHDRRGSSLEMDASTATKTMIEVRESHQSKNDCFANQILKSRTKETTNSKTVNVLFR